MYEQRRPMAVGDIMEAGFRVLMTHWRPLLLVHGLAALPGLMVTVATTVPEGQDINTEMMFFGFASMILVYPLTTGAGIKVAADVLGAQVPNLSEAIEYAVERYVSLLWAGWLMGFCVCLGFIFLIFPGFYVALRLCFTNHVVTLSESRGGKALGKSGDLMEGHYLRVGMLILVCALLGAVFGYGSGFLLSALDVVDMGSEGGSSLSFEMAVSVANVVPAAFLSVCMTIAFLDRLHLDEVPQAYQSMSSVPDVPTWAGQPADGPWSTGAGESEPTPTPTPPAGDESRFMPPEQTEPLPEPEPEPASEPEGDARFMRPEDNGETSPTDPSNELGTDEPKNSEPS